MQARGTSAILCRRPATGRTVRDDDVANPHPLSGPEGAIASPGPVDDSVARWRRLAEAGRDVFLTLEQQGDRPRLSWVSGATGQVLGISAQTLRSLPDPLTLFAHPADAARVDAAVASALRDGQEATVAYRWRHAGMATAPWRLLRLRLLPSDGPAAQVDGHLAVIDDDAQVRRRMATAVDHEAAALAAREHAEGLRDHILVALSHRVRTPLAILKASSQTALDPPAALDDAQRDDLFRRMARASDALESLLTDLLDLPAGRLVDLSAPTRLHPLVEQIVARVLAADRQVLLDVPDDLEVMGGAGVLGRVLPHLLGNIERHTPPTTRTRLAARVRDRHDLVITVSDDGPGLPEHVTANLYEPFVSGDHGPNPSLGLGLAVAHHLVTGQGGRLALAPPDDAGVTWTIELPDAVAG